MLIERLRVIRLRNTAADDAFMNFLAEKLSRTPYLTELDLADTRISDKGLQLTGLIPATAGLSGTRVTWRGLWATVEKLPSLEKVGLAGTAIGWLSRWPGQVGTQTQGGERTSNAVGYASRTPPENRQFGSVKIFVFSEFD